jgi:hypothetical protein
MLTALILLLRSMVVICGGSKAVALENLAHFGSSWPP